MSAALKIQPVSVEDYLGSELVSSVKHEYLGGIVHAMAGARILHNVIKGNVFGSLHARLKGKKCRPFDSDTKIRIKLPSQVRFYYPDVSVVCRPNPPTDSFHDNPAIVVEVLSRSTRRIDTGEKQDAYLTIPRLSVYMLVEQESAQVTLFRRTDQGFIREDYTEMDAVIPLPEIGTELSFAEIYDGAEPTPEAELEDEGARYG